MSHSDLALAARCQANAPGAFEELYRAHAPRLFGLTARLVGRLEAEDLLQDVFLAAHRKIGSYKGEAALGTWLFRLATNVCLDYLRSRAGRGSRLTDGLDDEPDAGPAQGGPILGVIERLDLERSLAALPPGARSVFVLHDVEGLEHKEVAALLGVSEGTSKSQLHRARLRLRELLAARPVASGRTP
jgi:RNA polymerase sigma-70 factor (ECF subfamily)